MNGLRNLRCLALPVLDSMDRPFESPPDMLTKRDCVFTKKQW